MEFTIRRLYIGVIALLLLTLLYVVVSYKTILSTQRGFIYHPETDQIYEVKLSAWIGHETLLRRLSPFSEVHYGVTSIGERLGYFQKLLNLAEEDSLLKEIDRTAWLEKRSDVLLSILQHFLNEDAPSLNYNYIEFAYLIRLDIDRSNQLLQLLPEIGQCIHEPSDDIFNVDVFLAKRSKESDEHKVEQLTESLLIRGRVASYLRYLGIVDPHFRSVYP